VLAMIEINLLPQEYRPRDSTNVPLLGTVVGGIIVVCFLFFTWMKVQGEVRDLETKNTGSEKKIAILDAEAKKIDKLKEEIDRQKSRQETIIEISQSKVMWSQKLEQFSDIMRSYRNFWVTTLTLSKSGSAKTGATSTLSMKVSGLGYDMREVAKLRDALQNDQNFFYHFARLDSFTVSRVSLTKYRNATERMDFEIKLPVQAGTPAAAAAAAPARGKKR
jgi:Tfp pilus assembly protein PilN